MLDVREWAEIRRMHEVEGLSIREIARRTGHDRNTIRRALRRQGPPVYCRPRRPSKLDPHKPRIHELLADDGRLCVKRVSERRGGARRTRSTRVGEEREGEMGGARGKGTPEQRHTQRPRERMKRSGH